MNEHAKVILTSSISSLPLIGGVLSTIIDKYIPEHSKNIKNQFIDQIEKALEESFDESNMIDSEKFINSFVHVYRLYQFEHSELKRNVLKNFIVNSTKFKSVDFEEEEMIVSIIDRLTADQIKMLLLCREKPLRRIDGSGVTEIINIWPNADKDYILSCLNNMFALNLMRVSGNKEHLEFIPTSFGEKVLTYISES